MLELNKLARTVKATVNVHLNYVKLAKEYHGLRILVATDANWARGANKMSQGGWLIWLAEDRDSNVSPCRAHVLSWRSWKLERVAGSTLNAEAQACERAAARALYFQRVLQWMTGSVFPIDLRTDCKSLYDNLTKSWQVDDKMTALIIESVKQHLKVGTIRSARHVPREYNHSDLLTRKCYSQVSERFRKMMQSGRVDGLA